VVTGSKPQPRKLSRWAPFFDYHMFAKTIVMKIRIRVLSIFSFLVFNVNFCKAQTKYEPNENYKLNFTDIRPLNGQQVTAAFKSLKELGIPYKYPQGGCESRAYLMGLLLDSMKLSNFRVWLLAPPVYVKDGKGGLTIKDLNDPASLITWTYHTAPVVLLKIDNTIDTIVLDPAINSIKPLKINEWFASMSGAENSVYYFVASKYFGYYSSNNLMNGNFYQYEGYAYENMSAEKNLALDYVGRYVHNMYLKKTGKKFDPTRISRLKPLISNIYNFQQYILQNTLPVESGTERSFYELSPDFIIDCKNVFNRQLKKYHFRLVKLSSM
jgi:hypothetical protein